MPAGELPRHCARAARVAAPHAHGCDRARGGIGVDDVRRQRARAHHEQPARVRPREVARRQRGSGRGATSRQFGAVQGGERHAVGGVEQCIGRVHSRVARQGIARKDGDELDPDAAAGLPGGHHQQEILPARRVADGVVLAHGRVKIRREGALQRVDQRHSAETRCNLTGIEL